MSSTNNEQQALANINDIAEAMSVNASTGSNSHDIPDLARRLDNVERLIEEVGLARDLQEQVADYVEDVRSELADMRNFRWWATSFAIFAAIGLFCILIFVIISQPVWLSSLDGKFQFAVLISFGGGSVALFTQILRAVYRSRADRNKDEILPEHLKVIIQAAKELKS